jgi:hypothetical protein
MGIKQMPARKRFWFALTVASLISSCTFAQAAPSGAAELVPGNFVEVTAGAGIHFLHQAPHTSKKYLIETMVEFLFHNGSHPSVPIKF